MNRGESINHDRTPHSKHDIDYLLMIATWVDTFFEERKEAPPTSEELYSEIKRDLYPKLKSGEITLGRRSKEVHEMRQELRQTTYELKRSEFDSSVLKEGLVSSYEGHGASIQSGPGTGDIGGVACVGEITNAQDVFAAGLDQCHFICFDKKTFLNATGMPFNQEELAQIIREIAQAIENHDETPFFSLHFNSQSQLYPIIAPPYKDTFVGEVIAELDYFMKGFLNGGIQIDGKYIDFNQYTKDHVPDARYRSMHEMYIENGLTDIINGLEESLESFDSQFSISFRILSKIKSITKDKEIVHFEPDFTVEYTIDEKAEYAEKRRETQLLSHKDRKEYERLENVCKKMCAHIKETMPKLPIFQEHFNKLQVITALTYYLKAMKQLGITPDLHALPKQTRYKTPTTLPHLPIRDCQAKK
jgi:hypothetical protein